MVRYWNNFNCWQYAVNLHWYLNCAIKNFIDNKVVTMLVYPGISVNRIRHRGRVMSYWGESQRYFINVSNISWKSDINCIILQAQNIWIRTVLKKSYFIAGKFKLNEN